MTKAATLELSLVLAASSEDDRGHEPERCLEALRPQVEGRNVEVFLVVDPGTDGTRVHQQFPWVQLVECSERRPVQELWGLALPHARGRIIAITDACCVPESDWVERILAAHQSEHLAIGGAIELPPDASTLDHAVYMARFFVRDTPLALPFEPGPTTDVPCENGSYKREALERYMESIRRGFYEIVVNADLMAEGVTLRCDPNLVVHYRNRFSALGFVRHRFTHGIHFGRLRRAESSPPKRAAYVATAGAIPSVFLLRVLRNVARKPRFLRPAVKAMPLVCVFVTAWAAGEFVGLIVPERSEHAPASATWAPTA